MDKNKIMKASILLPVFNAEKTITETLQSIINQTYKNFEIVIINDGSTDNSELYILKFKDTRIKYYKNETNKGLIYTLNRGIELCKGEYIIRIDADDIMLPNRIDIQISFMDNNPQIIASGSAVIKFYTNKKYTRIYTPPLSPEEIDAKILLGSPIPHPSSIIRKKILTEFNIKYDYNYLHAEDYKLWYDLSKHGFLANIEKPLIKYRCSETQISQKYNLKQVEISKRIRTLILNDILNKYGIILKQPLYLKQILDIANKLPDNTKNTTAIFLLILSLKKISLISIIKFIQSKIFMRKGFRYKYILAILIKSIKKDSFSRFHISEI